MIKKNPIPSRLYNASSDHPYVAGAVDIIDDRLNKNQEQVNEDTYRKGETYSKEETNNIISHTPETDVIVVDRQEGETVEEALDRVCPNTEDRPNKLFRVKNENNTHYDECAWNGTNWVVLASKDYGIDTTPVKDSQNLIESSAVFPIKSTIDYHLVTTENLFTTEGQVEGFVGDDGSIVIDPEYPNIRTTDFIAVEPSSTYYLTINSQPHFQLVVGFYNNREFIEKMTEVSTFVTPDNCTHVRITSKPLDIIGFEDKIMLTKDRGIPYIPNKELKEVSTGCEEKIRVLNYPTFGLAKFVAEDSIMNMQIDGDTNRWNLVIGAGFMLLPIEEFQKVRIYKKDKYAIRYAFLKGNSITRGELADFVYKYETEVDPITGEISWHIVYDHGNPVLDGTRIVSVGSDITDVAPPESKYLYILTYAFINSQSILNLPDLLAIDDVIYNEIKEESIESNIYNTVFFDDFNNGVDENVWTFHTQAPPCMLPSGYNWGYYNSYSDLHLPLPVDESEIPIALAAVISEPNSEDYCFVQIPPTPGEGQEVDLTTVYAVLLYKVNGNGVWVKEGEFGDYSSRFKTTSDNVFTDQGCLVLRCSKANPQEDNGNYRKINGDVEPIQYIAPYISTCDSLAIENGKVSARLRMSKGVEDGMFPFCFWTFGQNARWAYAFEADIIEGVVGLKKGTSTASDGHVILDGSHLADISHHLFYFNTLDNPGETKQEKLLKINWAIYDEGEPVLDEHGNPVSYNYINTIDTKEWHTYAVEWDKNSITYFIDEKPIVTYLARDINILNENGEVGFFHPQDIRFNIKAKETCVDQDSWMFVDWVKAEVTNLTPCLSIEHEDVTLNLGEGVYIEPTFNENCSNKAFTIEVEDESIAKHIKYNSDGGQQVIHYIQSVGRGETNVIICAANGHVENTFKVTVI